MEEKESIEGDHKKNHKRQKLTREEIGHVEKKQEIKQEAVQQE